MATAKIGSFRYNFHQKSKERLLSQKDSEWDIGSDIYEEGREMKCIVCFRRVSDGAVKLWNEGKDFVRKGWEMARSDPRKVIFSAKMGLALTLVSLLIFLKEPFKDLSTYSVWAILTIVVVFEFSIGKLLLFLVGSTYQRRLKCFLSSSAICMY